MHRDFKGALRQPPTLESMLKASSARNPAAATTGAATITVGDVIRAASAEAWSEMQARKKD